MAVVHLGPGPAPLNGMASGADAVEWHLSSFSRFPSPASLLACSIKREHCPWRHCPSLLGLLHAQGPSCSRAPQV
jgi:hypothetical protein